MSPMPKQRPHRSRQDYATPLAFINAVKLYLDIHSFTMDFAADVHNTKARKFWTEMDDSLAQSPERWAQRCGQGWGWLNPPFTDIGAWAQKCVRAQRCGAKIAMLVPASVGANWYCDFVHPAAYVLALNGRIAFDPSRPTWGYPKDCILALYGYGAIDFDVWTWK